MGLFKKFRIWLAKLPYNDPIERRLAPVLQLFFISLIAILLLAIVLSLIITGLSVQALVGLVPGFIFGLALVVGLYVLRRGYFNGALGLIIVALLVNQARSLLVTGFFANQQILLSSILPLTLAAFLLGRRLFILVGVVNFLTIAFVAIQEQAALTPAQFATTATPIARLTGFGLNIILLGILLDMLARAFHSELFASIQRQRELEAEIEARKAAQLSLAQQREQYHVTLASIGDAVIATDSAGQVTFMNEIAAALTGWPPDEGLGKPLSQVFPIMNENTLEAVENPLIKVLADGVIVGLANHTVLVQRDGTKLPIADSGAPIRGEDGKVIGAVLVFRDVTEERRAEAELKESEDRFRMMADSAPVLIWMADLDKLCTYFNQQWLAFTRRTLEQEVGNGWREGVHPDDYERCFETYSSAMDKREAFSMEYRLRRWDGDYIWVLYAGAPRFLADGSFAGYIGSCIDINARKEAEDRTELLQTLTAELSSTLTVEEVAQVFVEKGFGLLGASLGVVALLDTDGDSMTIIGQKNIPAALLAPYQPLPLDAPTHLSQAVRQREPVWIENFEQYQSQYPELAAQSRAAGTKTQSNASLPLIVNYRLIGGINMSFPYPQRWDEERRAFLMAVAQQCAQAMERAQLHHQAQLAAALEERQRLARELHDAVSQTLFSATIIAESLPSIWQRDPTLGNDQVQQLGVLNRAAMSEMRALLLELRPEAILKTNLSILMQQLVEAAKGRKNLQADIEIAHEDGELPPNVHVALYRIAQESINNILKHSQATQFSLRLEAEAARAQLTIRDNGVGFDPAVLNAGLGLNNTRERVAAIGAALDIRSQPGEGTQVDVKWVADDESVED